MCTPVTPHTVFEAALLSKPLFAYAALGLAERGSLDLDVPLAQYVTEPLIAGEERVALITARRMLSHASGLPNWRRDKPLALCIFTNGENGYRVWSNVLCHTLDPDGAILHWLERL